jgi:hypothetical protein
MKDKSLFHNDISSRILFVPLVAGCNKRKFNCHDPPSPVLGSIFSSSPREVLLLSQSISIRIVFLLTENPF